MEIGGVQPNDFRVLIRRLRQQIFVRSDDIRHLHVRTIGIAARPNNVAFEVNGVLVARRDGKHADAIAILDLERNELLRDLRIAIDFRQIKTQHRLLLVRDQPLYFDMP